MKTAHIFTQCKAPNGEIGDFLATIENTGMVLISPIFQDLILLFNWCHINKWKQKDNGYTHYQK